MLTVEQLIACELEKAEASQITEAVNQILPTQSPTVCWGRNFTLYPHATTPVCPPPIAL